MKNNIRGSYTVEAAIFLPLVILAILSMGYFVKVDGLWENCIHGAVDESLRVASRSYDGGSNTMIGVKVKNRIVEENPMADRISVTDLRIGYSDAYADNLTSYRIKGEVQLSLPLGFQRTFQMEQGIKYRGFTGKKTVGTPMGDEGLETDVAGNPVWIFPQSGQRYHGEECTYVKAAVTPVVLTERIKKEYDSCGLCCSGDTAMGTIVFCFKGEDTSYHRGTCSSIVKHTMVVDRTEAIKKGYEPCSKCGGK